MPKLTKKHRTFDCDLNYTEQTPQPIDLSRCPGIDGHHQQQQQQSTNNNPYQSSTSGTLANSALNDSANILNYNNNTTNYPSDLGANERRNLGQIENTYPTRQSIYGNNNNNNADEPDATNQHSKQLSKLVLSSSLHQLADSKFHTQNYYNHQQQQKRIINAQTDDMMMPQPNNNRRHNNNNHNQNHDENVATQNDNDTNNNNTDDADDDAKHEPASNYKNNNNHNHDSVESSPINQQQQQQHQITKMVPQTKQQQQQNHTTPAKMHNTQNNQREANLDTVHVVVGNESCDLDSAVSCLLMFHIISKMSDEINGKDKTRTLYIPLLNTTRDMLDSKCEVLWFLQKTLNIDKSFLTCKDDIDWNEIKKNGVEVLVTLVDHNYNDEFKDIGKIVEIIDHHQVQNSQWLMENQSSIRLTLDTSVGSCTTLVAERLFYIYAEHHVSDEILLLIYGTVLLDTICLSEKAKRFTRRDVYLLKKLDALLGTKRPVRDELYRQLVEVKNSTKELNFEKLMKRDLKIYKDKHGMRVGIASLFGMAAKEALGLAANIDLDQFFRQNQYEAFIIMGLIADLDHSDSISRDLVLISANSRLFDELCRAFEQDTSKLDLVPIGSDSSPDPEDNIINNKKIIDSGSEPSASNPFYKARIWLQRNVTSSRKVVAPLVLKVLHDGVQN